MSLLLGTSDGVYRSATDSLADAERVLASGVTLRVRTFGRDSFTASKTGLYRSRDGGETWTDLGVPREVYSVVRSPDGTRLYAGTHPAHVYASSDDGDTWADLEGFQKLPSRDEWHTPRHRHAAHVRSLGVHPDAPDRVIAGVEVGGVHVSDDGGRTWSERRAGLETDRRDDLQYDVHHVLVADADEYLVSCGGGLYRTRDAGLTWTRLETDSDRPYVHETIVVEDRLYAGVQSLPPTLPGEDGTLERDADARVVESTDSGETVAVDSSPGTPDAFVSAWTVADGRVYAGTTDGRVLVREVDGWTALGRLPTWIRSLATV